MTAAVARCWGFARSAADFSGRLRRGAGEPRIGASLRRPDEDQPNKDKTTEQGSGWTDKDQSKPLGQQPGQTGQPGQPSSTGTQPQGGTQQPGGSQPKGDTQTGGMGGTTQGGSSYQGGTSYQGGSSYQGEKVWKGEGDEEEGKPSTPSTQEQGTPR